MKTGDQQVATIVECEHTHIIFFLNLLNCKVLHVKLCMTFMIGFEESLTSPFGDLPERYGEVLAHEGKVFLIFAELDVLYWP